MNKTTKILTLALIPVFVMACGNDKSASTTENKQSPEPQQVANAHDPEYAAILALPLNTAYTLPNSSNYIHTDTVKLDPALAKGVCDETDGITKLGTGGVAFGGPERHLLSNGGIEKVDVYWDENYKLGQNCRVDITVAGLYNGSQYHRTIHAWVNVILKNKEGRFLVHSASIY